MKVINEWDWNSLVYIEGTKILILITHKDTVKLSHTLPMKVKIIRNKNNNCKRKMDNRIELNKILKFSSHEEGIWYKQLSLFLGHLHLRNAWGSVPSLLLITASCFCIPWEAASHGSTIGLLSRLWETKMDLRLLAWVQPSPGCCQGLGSKSAHRRAFSILLYVSQLFKQIKN